jgi:hypothetical protein
VIKPIIILASLLSTYCFAEKNPMNLLQVQYQESIKKNSTEFYLNPVFQIPEATYLYLDSVFTSFYQKMTFNASIAKSTFKKNAYYQVIAIPIIPTNTGRFQLEFFGHLSNPASQHLSDFSADHLLYNYRSNSQALDLYRSDLALGAGISFNTGSNSKIKIVISNNEIPGYGTSKALVGFESQF